MFFTAQQEADNQLKQVDVFNDTAVSYYDKAMTYDPQDPRRFDNLNKANELATEAARLSFVTYSPKDRASLHQILPEMQQDIDEATAVLSQNLGDYQYTPPSHGGFVGTKNARTFLAEVVEPAVGQYGLAGLKAAGKAIGGLTPDGMEKTIVEASKDLAWDIKENPLVQEGVEVLSTAFTQGKEYIWDDWAEKHPEQAKGIKDTFLVSTLLAPRVKPTASATEWAGSKLEKSGTRQVNTKTFSNASKVFWPDRSAMFKTSQVTGGKPVPDKNGMIIEYHLDDRQKRAAARLMQVPHIDFTAHPSWNYSRVTDEITNTAEALVAGIEKAGNPRFDKEALTKHLYGEAEALYASRGFQHISGNPKIVQPLMDEWASLIKESDGTALGLLQARKDFDKWVEAWKPSDLQGDVVSARAFGISMSRKLMNDEVASLVQGKVPVKNLLRKQRDLYYARDFIQPRADGEKAGRIARIQRLLNFSPSVSLPKTPMAMGANVAFAGSIATATWFLPALATVGATGLAAGGYTFLRSPQARKFYGQALISVSDAMKKSTDVVERNMLNADRVALIEWIREIDREAALEDEAEDETQRVPVRGVAN